MPCARGPRIVAFLLATAAIAACKTRDRNAVDTVTLRIDSAAGDVRSNAPGAASPMVRDGATWNPATALGFAIAGNSGEIALGQLGESRATTPAVRAFAHRMVTDHQQMLASATALGTAMAITPDTTTFDARNMLEDARDDGKELTAETPGVKWDRAYLRATIDTHENMIAALRDASKHATSPRMRRVVDQTVATLTTHLAEARRIEASFQR